MMWQFRRLWWDFQAFLAQVREEIGMVQHLWDVVPSDCRTALVGELILNPRALRERYENEHEFRAKLESRWH